MDPTVTNTVAIGGAVSAIVFSLIFLVLGILVYFIPTFIANKKNHTQKTPILLLNIFLGWTFLGWVGALIWACVKENNKSGN